MRRVLLRALVASMRREREMAERLLLIEEKLDGAPLWERHPLLDRLEAMGVDPDRLYVQDVRVERTMYTLSMGKGVYQAGFVAAGMDRVFRGPTYVSIQGVIEDDPYTR